MTDHAAAVKKVRAYAADVETFHRHATQRDVAALLRAYDTLRAQHAALVVRITEIEGYLRYAPPTRCVESLWSQNACACIPRCLDREKHWQAALAIATLGGQEGA